MHPESWRVATLASVDGRRKHARGLAGMRTTERGISRLRAALQQRGGLSTSKGCAGTDCRKWLPQAEPLKLELLPTRAHHVVLSCVDRVVHA